MYPSCASTKTVGQRCIRVEKDKDNKTICRLMKDFQEDPAKAKRGRIYRDWFPEAACKVDPKSSDIFVSLRPERVLSKGYYPLCRETEDPKSPCLLLYNTDKPKDAYCRIAPNAEADPAKLEKGKQFVDWFPAPQYCRPLYARVFKAWKTIREESRTEVAYFPICQDVKGANQQCIYRTRIKQKEKVLPQMVCLVSDSPTIRRAEITPAEQAFENWYPLTHCQEAGGSTTFLSILFAFFGFALFAFFASYFGGWVGERWQGTL
jgi:hypothetical protein